MIFERKLSNCGDASIISKISQGKLISTVLRLCFSNIHFLQPRQKFLILFLLYRNWEISTSWRKVRFWNFSFMYFSLLDLHRHSNHPHYKVNTFCSQASGLQQILKTNALGLSNMPCIIISAKNYGHYFLTFSIHISVTLPVINLLMIKEVFTWVAIKIIH